MNSMLTQKRVPFGLFTSKYLRKKGVLRNNLVFDYPDVLDPRLYDISDLE